MGAHLDYLVRPDGKGIEVNTVINDRILDVQRIVPCANLVDRCNVEYPRFPCWQGCGHSYIEANGLVACKNSEMVKRLLGLDI